MNTTHKPRSQAPRTWLGVCAFLTIAALLLWTEHRAHLLGVLPYLLLAACPIIHLLMHRSHGARGHDRHRRPGGVS